eukprot:3411584-Ditylum_brightwellii.AAC.1
MDDLLKHTWVLPYDYDPQLMEKYGLLQIFTKTPFLVPSTVDNVIAEEWFYNKKSMFILRQGKPQSSSHMTDTRRTMSTPIVWSFSTNHSWLGISPKDMISHAGRVYP